MLADHALRACDANRDLRIRLLLDHAGTNCPSRIRRKLPRQFIDAPIATEPGVPLEFVLLSTIGAHPKTPARRIFRPARSHARSNLSCAIPNIDAKAGARS